MKYRLMIFLIMFFLVSPWVYSASFTSITPSAATVERYAKYEVSFTLGSSYTNPYDPELIGVTALFTAPSAAVQTGIGFWYQDYIDGTPVGTAQWKLRFAPKETGIYTYKIMAKDSLSTATSTTMQFTAVASSRSGFISLHPSNRKYMKFDNGAVYIPIGYNCAFNSLDANGTQYDEYYSKKSANGMNWTRFWMTDFNTCALEWGSGHWSGWYSGIGKYSQQAAARVDKVVQKAEKYGIYMQLVLNDHGQFSTFVNQRWNNDGGNAYNSAAGGPVPQADPLIFFGNSTAKNYFKNRLRYIIARWGYSPNILAWELFNEVQFCGTSFNNSFRGSGAYANNTAKPYINSWHSEMALYLKQNDAWKHLVTTSSEDDYGYANFATIWSDSNIDITQLHTYHYNVSPRDLCIRNYAVSLKGYNKPHILGEFGLENSPENGFNPNTYSGTSMDREHLRQGTNMHNLMWTSAVSESGAMLWWWDSYITVDSSKNRVPPDFPQDQHGKAIRAFVQGEDFPSYGLTDANPTVSGSIHAYGTVSPSRGFFWLRDSNNEFGTGYMPGNLVNRTISNATVTIAGFTPNTTYLVQYYNSWGNGGTTGIVAMVNANASGTITIGITSFQRDIALKIIRAETGSPPTANFYGTPTSGVAPLPVYFYDTSSGTPSSWLWTFGDGASSTTKNPVHTYTNPGVYPVTLVVSNNYGSSTITKSNYITAGSLPTANFYGTPSTGSAPLPVQFYDTSVGIPMPTAWLWTFGDGSTAGEKNPAHNYIQPGKYTVTLVVSNGFGSTTATKNNYIAVFPASIIELLPDIKLLNNHTLNNAFILSDYTTATGWQPFYVGNIANVNIAPVNTAVDYLTPLSASYGMDTVIYIADGSNGYPSVVKYSTYLFNRLPEVLVDDGWNIANETINLADYISKNTVSGSPASYPYAVRYRNSSDSGKLSINFAGSTIQVRPNSALFAPAEVMVTATPAPASFEQGDWDKEIIYVYELANQFGQFTASSDTSHWYFEVYGDGAGAGTLSWTSSWNVISIMQAAGQKAKLSQIFSVPSSGWYTAKVKVATDVADISKQQKVYLYLQELNQDTGIVTSANQVVAPGNGGLGDAWTWKEMAISYYTQSTLLGIQVVSINPSSSGAWGSLYLADIWVYPAAPRVDRSYGTAKVHFVNPTFDAGTTGWFFEPYGDAATAGVWTTAWSVLALTQTGGEKGKTSQLFSFPNHTPEKNAMASGWVYSQVTAISNTHKVYLYLYSFDSSYTKIMESGTVILYAGKWTPNEWRQLQFGYTPLTVNNAVQLVGINPEGNSYKTIYFDNLEIKQEQDSPYYWDDKLF
ncbi:MAG: PKD domain-containing protein [bacterium]|nr:PKD domain-containing protein [bacterium]